MPRSDEPQNKADTFAALFEQQSKGAPRARAPHVGDVLEVIVVQVGKDTVFVELDGKRQAYLDAEELRTPEGALEVAVGQTIRARVVEIEQSTGNVRLGALGGVTAKLLVGATVNGTVDRIEQYGVFLQIDGTKGRDGRGLIPAAELGVPRGTDLRKKFPEGTKLTAKIVDLSEGKMRLSLRALKDDEEKKQVDEFKKKAAPPPRTLGTFGDLLQKAQQKKK